MTLSLSACLFFLSGIPYFHVAVAFQGVWCHPLITLCVYVCVALGGIWLLWLYLLGLYLCSHSDSFVPPVSLGVRLRSGCR